MRIVERLRDCLSPAAGASRIALVALTAAAFVSRARAADAARPAALSVAAAANLVYALDALNAEFGKTAPEIAVTSATGASGSLVAQIAHGAPYDVFLSADRGFAQALVNAGNADAKSLSTFAVGRLVLWTTRAAVDVSDVAGAVRSPLVRKLAVANVDTAPYGRAAQQALKALGAWGDAQPKIVMGENISQTAQFVETGNADAGFVALSIVISPRLKGRGRWTEVPEALHEPLEQCAVITTRGSANPAATRYVAFLNSPAARAILEAFGYGIPPGAKPGG
jgi:molybdate transport system substrate-binding protein